MLGWDASGVVEATGPDVKLFKRGDAVYYAETSQPLELGRLMGFQTPDMEEQHRNPEAGGRVAANLRAAHAKVESGKMVGKLVLEGWH